MSNYFILVGKIEHYEFYGVCGVLALNVEGNLFSVVIPTALCEEHEELFAPGKVIGVSGDLGLVIDNVILKAQKIIETGEVSNDRC